jgi:methylthioribose-1-phosphate isomerase
MERERRVSISGPQRIIFPTVDFRSGAIEIIDQTLLPREEKILRLETVDALTEALGTLRVRGAPAIGIAGAYGMLLALECHLKAHVGRRPNYFFDRVEGITDFKPGGLDVGAMRAELEAARSRIAATRPTAVNLFWALEEMSAAARAPEDPVALCARVAESAFGIRERELETEIAIGQNGAPLVEDGMRVLTHCNAGGLATAGYGTALGVLYAAQEQGKGFRVYVDETRPLLQGARLTAWELAKHGIEHTILCDGAAASLFAAGLVDAVIVGADRIAANGDTANKIGTLMLAVLCEKFGKPFYVAAPRSTFDLRASSGGEIPIEERSGEEVACFAGAPVAPEGARAYNPAFDVTPAGMIAAIITERGVIERPERQKIEKCMRAPRG